MFVWTVKFFLNHSTSAAITLHWELQGESFNSYVGNLLPRLRFFPRLRWSSIANSIPIWITKRLCLLTLGHDKASTADPGGGVAVKRMQRKLTSFWRSSDKLFKSANWPLVIKGDRAKKVAPFHTAETLEPLWDSCLSISQEAPETSWPERSCETDRIWYIKRRGASRERNRLYGSG